VCLTASPLHLAAVSKGFDGLIVLRDVTLELAPGERVGLVGANGAGKSTLTRLIGGWMRPNSGTIRIFGEDITDWSTFRRYAFGLRELPQFPQVSGELTGAETICVGQMAPKLWQLKWLQSSRTVKRSTSELLNGLVSPAELQSTLGALSFGSRKMIAMAAVLACHPRLLLLDEPTVGLDEVQRRTLGSFLSRMENCAMLIIEHDTSFVKTTCHRLTELRDGCLRECER